ncbi:type I glyceraldehyde-3-phosphate dehydrogenase [Helicobacter enhydrae]|uniref:Glyceraldehyde-3-phosphate dehydrogenase n=1 Tax=Helicobacter enhydrae TaxID=222136 RepID=A0A1B1U3Y0_9HELI|nr:type I glyceraldehyde-3-phosphate dehydrogenase [Helicobacter enhydrae]ANV97470.1 type I glyceraldehyde-3-phosphate dehydrogenase [Helicobacter enhydrae]
MKIALNGFGRLGRSIARVIFANPNVELVGINDVSDWEILAYLLQNDSVHRRLDLPIQYQDGFLCVGNQHIKVFNCANPYDLDFASLGADVVIESSGLFLRREQVQHHLDKGAKRVIFSAPAQDDTPTFVMGVNHHLYNGEPIISNASCTTNALAPICKIFEEHFRIHNAILSTIHSYTNDQNLLDNAHRSDKRRSRNAGLNIIPTTTGSAKALHLVLPTLKGKIDGHSVRVPVADVSMVDLALHLHTRADLKQVNVLFEHYASEGMRGIVSIDDGYRVSSDFIGNPHSVILAKDLSFVMQGEYVKVMGWYDNEWGYANRIVEMAEYICKD